MNPTTDSHEGGLSVRDQIRRYQTAFTAVVTMVVIAAFVGGYILAHENLKLPGWVPILGKSYFTLKADFQTAQAVTPGQGQAVTIAGAKIGEIASVDLQNGVGVVTMHLTPKYARGRIYHDATILLRPKTALQDLTVEISPGTASSGALSSGATIPLSQTSPNIDFDEFIAGLDTESRAYLQELLAGAGEGLKGNGKALSAAFKRFDPIARDLQEIGTQLNIRHADVANGIHNFRLLLEALGGKDRQLSELVQSGNTVQAREGRARARADTEGAAAVRQGARPRGASLAGDVHKDHPDLQAADPPVRAPDPARDQRSAARHQGTERVVPGAGKQLLGAQRTLQRVRLQPRTQ
jgi:phospholipid/cholesterol/gamma-HCH transport system substrate-binding protein